MDPAGPLNDYLEALDRTHAEHMTGGLSERDYLALLDRALGRMPGDVHHAFLLDHLPQSLLPIWHGLRSVTSYSVFALTHALTDARVIADHDVLTADDAERLRGVADVLRSIQFDRSGGLVTRSRSWIEREDAEQAYRDLGRPVEPPRIPASLLQTAMELAYTRHGIAQELFGAIQGCRELPVAFRAIELPELPRAAEFAAAIAHPYLSFDPRAAATPAATAQFAIAFLALDLTRNTNDVAQRGHLGRASTTSLPPTSVVLRSRKETVAFLHGMAVGMEYGIRGSSLDKTGEFVIRISHSGVGRTEHAASDRVGETESDPYLPNGIAFRRAPADSISGGGEGQSETGKTEPDGGSSGPPEAETSSAPSLFPTQADTGAHQDQMRNRPDDDWRLAVPEDLQAILDNAPSTVPEIDGYFERVVSRRWLDPAARALALAVYRDEPVGYSTSHLGAQAERDIGFFSAEMRVLREKSRGR